MQDDDDSQEQRLNYRLGLTYGILYMLVSVPSLVTARSCADWVVPEADIVIWIYMFMYMVSLAVSGLYSQLVVWPRFRAIHDAIVVIVIVLNAILCHVLWFICLIPVNSLVWLVFLDGFNLTWIVSSGCRAKLWSSVEDVEQNNRQSQSARRIERHYPGIRASNLFQSIAYSNQNQRAAAPALP